jgi:hypothetical protein
MSTNVGTLICCWRRVGGGVRCPTPPHPPERLHQDACMVGREVPCTPVENNKDELSQAEA